MMNVVLKTMSCLFAAEFPEVKARMVARMWELYAATYQTNARYTVRSWGNHDFLLKTHDFLLNKPDCLLKNTGFTWKSRFSVEIGFTWKCR